MYFYKRQIEGNRKMNDFTFQRAVPEDADAVFALYQSLVGTPFCAWDATYPALEHVHDDIAAGALCTLRSGAELIAAGTIRRCPEHDEIPCWTPMRNPCDLMRIGVALPRQGHGTGHLFLTLLLAESARRGYDYMRILVAETNLPAIALYRRIGADFRGEAFSYGIHWLCAQVPCRE